MKSYIVDSFTHEPFKGNPAGVCFLENELNDEVMLKIAQEFGLSETAFVKATARTDTYSIRFFSPQKEIPLCGHATLAAAKVIFKSTELHEIHFITWHNLDLTIKKVDHEIIMEFPVYDTIAATVPATMLKALGLDSITQASFSKESKIMVLEIDDCDLLTRLNPDFIGLVKTYDDINGVLVTAPSKNSYYDFHYRYFWPWAGTNEDPVTGGVQTFLAKYWAKKLNKTKMKAFQSSSRTGLMTVELQGGKVYIYGEAIIILEGNLVALG
jgi:PhzF family phenazine biosynthesis protein